MRPICFAGSAVRAEALQVLAPCQLSFAIQRIQVRQVHWAKVRPVGTLSWKHRHHQLVSYIYREN